MIPHDDPLCYIDYLVREATLSNWLLEMEMIELFPYWYKILIVSTLLHAEFGRNYHREDEPHFIC